LVQQVLLSLLASSPIYWGRSLRRGGANGSECGVPAPTSFPVGAESGCRRRLGELISSGAIQSEVAASYSVVELVKALELAAESGRNGKVLLTSGG